MDNQFLAANIFQLLYWQLIRTHVIVPLLKGSVVLCLVTSMMLFFDKACMAIVVLVVKLLGRKPQRVYRSDAIVANDGDVEQGNYAVYPMVLVQIPMYNEREVYQLSIGAACRLDWPRERLIVQVLDDSTDPEIQEMVQHECRRWAAAGIDIKYEIRSDRVGYKAGALMKGMQHVYVGRCDYVAIFDADFQPEPDFLMRSIPFLHHNPEIGLVQARWKFVNANECLMTRMQEMSLDYHFAVEQEAGSSACAFFGFNGTAGVWRISALNEAGGWQDRTTVEDMDLAVRAILRGCKFVFLGDLKVKSELPSSFKTYRHQQHRWSCGPANLFRKMAVEIMNNTRVNAWKKFYLIYSFFFVRKVIAHLVTFFFYCIVIPAAVTLPEVEVPKWGAIYVPLAMTIVNALSTPRSLHLLLFWILFENVMSLHRAKATIMGLLKAGNVNQWVVTEKVGDTAMNLQPIRRNRLRIRERLHLLEIGVGVYLFFTASYNVAYGKDNYFIYLYLQAAAFFIMGFGYVGNFVPRP